MFAIDACFGAGAGCGGAKRWGKAGEVGVVIQHEPPGLLVGEHVLHELRGERGKSAVDFGNALFRSNAELGASAHEPQMLQFEDAALLVIELQAVTAPIQIINTRKQLGIEEYRTLMGGKLGREVTLNCLQLGVGVGTGEIEENARHAIKHAAALFHRDNGIGERGFRLACANAIDLFAMLGECHLKRRRKMFRGDVSERRQLEGSIPLRREQRVAARGWLGGWRPVFLWSGHLVSL